ncbi:MAG: hypothetical protein WCP01_11530 [Methylococcaceae bacterium]
MTDYELLLKKDLWDDGEVIDLIVKGFKSKIEPLSGVYQENREAMEGYGLLDLMLSSIDAGTLSPHTSRYSEVMQRMIYCFKPMVIIAWAVSKEIRLPEELLQWAAAKGFQLPDDYLKSNMQQQENSRCLKLEDMADDQRVQLYYPTLMQELIKSIGPEIRSDTALRQCDEEKPQNENERKTMLKLILGMAMDSYGYDPHTEKRQTATGDNKNGISAKIKTRGISVSNDTILRYLTEAKDLL